MSVRIPVGPLRFDPLTEAACVRHIFAEIEAGRGGRVATVNTDQLALCARHPDFAAFCARASVIVADGMPVVWASRLQGTPLPARVTGSDLLFSVCARAAEEGRTVLLAGGSPGTAERAARALQARAPGLRVVGTVCPAPAAEPDRVALEELRAVLLATRPDIVFVGLPSLKTHHLVAACQDLLPRAWWIGVGVGFSFAAGALPRAPRWQQQLGLEWAHRLVVEPRRLAARYFLRAMPAAIRLLARSARQRIGSARALAASDAGQAPGGPERTSAFRLALRVLSGRPVLFGAVVLVSLVASLAEGLGLGAVLALIPAGPAESATQTGLPRFGAALDAIAGTDAVARVRLAAVVLFVTMLVRGIFYYASRVLAAWMEASFVHDMRSRVFEQMLALEAGHVHDRPMGALLTTLVAHTNDAGVMLKDACRSIVDLGTIGVYAALLLLVSWQITLITVALLAAVTLVLRLGTGRRLTRSGARAARALAEVEAAGLEGLGGLELIHLYGREADVAARFREASRRHRQALLRTGLLVNLSRPILMTANALALSLLILGVTLIYPGQAAAWGGYAVLLLAIAFRLMSPAAALGDAHNVVETLAPSLENVMRFLERADRAGVRSGPTRFTGLAHGIRFVDVGFRYEEAGPAILRGVSFDLPRGRVVALLGASGQGKTTIAKLIARLHDCSEGAILVDGIDLRALELRTWRSRIAMVSQDTFLFHDTLMANLRFVRPDASDAEIRAAAARAGADAFVARLPDGYETVVGHRGARLSGGQRQLVALTRAILVEPDVLILDEATSQLDVDSELHVQRVIAGLRPRCAVLVIAHRLSTVRDADSIVVLQDGRVVESGTPGELLARPGWYTTLVERQSVPRSLLAGPHA